MVDLSLMTKLVELLERPRATFARFGKFQKVWSKPAQQRPGRSQRWRERGPSFMVSVDGQGAPAAVHYSRPKAESEAATLALKHQRIARVLIVSDVIIPIGGHTVLHGDVLINDWSVDRWESRQEIAAKAVEVEALAEAETEAHPT